MKVEKYYAVKVGRKRGVYLKWHDCLKQVNKYPNAKYKSFSTLEEAEKYSGTKGLTGEKAKVTEKKIKICPICEKPHKSANQCCVICSRRLKELKDFVEPYSNRERVSISKVINIKTKYNQANIFDFIKANPYVWRTLDSYKERLKNKGRLREYHRSSEYRNQKYTKWEGEIPLYIYETMKLYPTKKLLTISGKKTNPNIHYVCLKCEEEQMQLYEDIKNNKGHDCIDIKSSGEVIVENYLKSFTTIKTQYDTLKCINPVTKYQLPYDIEIVNRNIVVEIQGEQHLKYIEYFHGTIDNFYYQQRKDDYKKRFAESKGYKIIYIYYSELKDNTYKEKINRALELGVTTRN